MVCGASVFPAIALSLILLSACSKGSDIPLASSSQPPTTSTTGAPKNPNQPHGPSGPADPSAPSETRYRLFCDDLYPPYLMAISSMASNTGFGSGFYTTEDDGNRKQDPSTEQNLKMQQNPQVVSLPKFGEARILFSALKKPNGLATPTDKRYIFITDVSLVKRAALAKLIANEARWQGAISTFADKENLDVKTFAASDKGRYLLIGQGDGYRILDSVTLKSLGVLQIGSASLNVNPFLRESDMLFTVSNADGSSLTSKIYSVAMTSAGTLKSVALVTTVPALRYPLQSLGPAPGESFAAIDTSNRIAVVSPLKKSPGVTRSVIANLPSKGRLSSNAAFWRDSKGNAVRAAIVFENFVATLTGITRRYRIEQAFVRALIVDETNLKASAIGADYDYPAEARSTVELGVVSQMHPGVSDFKSSPDGEAVFGLFPGALSMQAYRLTGMGLTRVSQESCTNFSIGVEQ